MLEVVRDPFNEAVSFLARSEHCLVNLHPVVSTSEHGGCRKEFTLSWITSSQPAVFIEHSVGQLVH